MGLVKKSYYLALADALLQLLETISVNPFPSFGTTVVLQKDIRSAWFTQSDGVRKGIPAHLCFVPRLLPAEQLTI